MGECKAIDEGATTRRANRSMKILHLLGVPSIGGTETHCIAVVRGLIERGHDAVLANTWDDGLVNDYAVREGIPFFGIRGGTYAVGPKWFWRVGRFLRRHRFDIVQSHGLRVSLALRMMQNVVGVKHHIKCIRGLERQRRRIEMYFDRVTERRLSVILCNSQAVADRRHQMAGTRRERMLLIPNGIDVDEFGPDFPMSSREELGLPPGFLFVKVGSFREEKDHGTLLDAFGRSRDLLQDAKIVLVGGGKLESEIRAKTEQLGLADRVVFCGISADVRPILKSCDAFVMSSHSEGMPRAMMEAMSMGMAVVATAAGGVPEVAEDERSALIVPTRDAARLADRMVRVYKDASLRERLGGAAAARIRGHFSLELMLDRYEEIYRGVLAGQIGPSLSHAKPEIESN